ncbi:rifin [Plasmodium reichenowi]|uniref:Rifin n=1 Tax=Plasmodium reichenowi TaxID=5854 RepID=A0A060RLU2_PLARE|nr:rifin [Plasmodium reichenowi]
MKLHFCKILLFFLPLNIWEHNKDKIYITPHHTQTNRSLCECDKQSSIYDKDADMKSVIQQFDDHTSQRFEEYQERMKGKRQKRKEERDKKTQEIIEKDKREKSLAEKVEKGCLRCGCALGGVAPSVGLFGGLGIYGWKMGALATAKEAVKDAAMVAGEAARIQAVKSAFIEGIKTKFGVSIQGVQGLETLFTTNTHPNASNISKLIYSHFNTTCIPRGTDTSFCTLAWKYSESGRNGASASESIKIGVETIVREAEPIATAAAKKASDEVIQKSIAVVDAKSAYLYSAIGYSVLAILIIILVMIIIYLVLRYRRKKKMNKKAQYTKLLNQ